MKSFDFSKLPFPFLFFPCGGMISQMQRERANSLSQPKAQFILQKNFVQWSKRRNCESCCCFPRSLVGGAVSELSLKRSVRPSANICIAFQRAESVWRCVITGGGLRAGAARCPAGLWMGAGGGLFALWLSGSPARRCQRSALFDGEFTTCTCKDSFRR